MSTPQRVFVTKMNGLGVFDPLGDQVGKARDIVCVPRSQGRPRVVGLVVEVPGKRNVFVPMTRITSLEGGQIITTGLVNMRRFALRSTEALAIGELLERPVVAHPHSGDESFECTVEDLAMLQLRSGDWEIAKVFARKGPPRRGLTGRLRRIGEQVLLDYEEVAGLTGPTVQDQGAALLIESFEGMKAADIADRIRDLPARRRRDIAAELPPEQLADVLEELGDDDQIALLGALDEDMAADVLEAMQPDDAADLLHELSSEQQEHFLHLMEPGEAEDVRRLLAYDEYTAGGLMTTVPVIMSPEDSIAEGLAMVRRAELSPTIAAAVFVCRPPLETPTGKFLGIVHIQRMLRHAPHESIGSIVDSDVDALGPDAPLSHVTRQMATYNMVSVPVTDPDGRLLGVVTVDDVLDHLLPDDWRDMDELPSDPVTGQIPLTSLDAVAAARGRARNSGGPHGRQA